MRVRASDASALLVPIGYDTLSPSRHVGNELRNTSDSRLPYERWN